ncbi:MAG: DEAD/DEAH box helicase [Deltaproteobacteria bacterium]|nr:DEAD/DEAH box helicase [Deltaproteobacteria bacterium]
MQSQPEITQAAPATKTFKEIVTNPAVLAALERLQIQTPTPVQAQAIPCALSGKDLIVQAKTGSGKTLAFVLPLLSLLEHNEDQRNTFALIVSPTRELANQICTVIKSVTDKVEPVCLIGGASMRDQEEALNRDHRVIVGTPGRILDFIRQRLIQLRKCQYFVLDEADEMLSMGFLEEVRAILSRLPDRRQGLFISATITPRVDMLANSFLTKPERIIINTEGEERAPIEHLYCEVTSEITAKANAVCDLIETQRPRSTVIFCNTKSDTELVEVFLRRRGFNARRLNSDLTQRERDLVMTQIRAGELQILIATDIAARGLDVEQIDLVFNYAIPEEAEAYIHRTGRTGRAGRSGRAISLVGPQDFTYFHNLKRFLDFELTKLPLPSEDDVLNARLAHFYEIVRQEDIEVQSKELVLAKKLLSELGGMEEPSEEFTVMIAKLCRFTIEHCVRQDAKPAAAVAAPVRSDEARPPRSYEDRGPRQERSPQHRSRDGGGRGRGGNDRGGRGGGQGRDRR